MSLRPGGGGSGGGSALPRRGALASRGAAADYPGGVYVTTDAGIDGGVTWLSDGTSWIVTSYSLHPSLGSPLILLDGLETSGTAVANTGSVSGAFSAAAVLAHRGVFGRASGILVEDSTISGARGAITGLSGAGAQRPTGSISVGFWYRPGSPRSWRYYPSGHSGGNLFAAHYSTSWGSPYSGIHGRIDADGAISISVTTGTTGSGTRVSTTASGATRVALGSEVFVCAVRDTADAVLRLYLGGELAAQVTAGSAGQNIDWGTSPGLWSLGGLPTGYSGSSEEAIGTYGRFFVLNSALSAAQVRQLDRRGRGVWRGE